MKAWIDKNGVLRLEPDTELEAFALSCWVAKSSIQVELPHVFEHEVFRGSSMLVSFNPPASAK